MGLDELEDFRDIESGGTNDQTPDLSNVYNIKLGGFGKQNGLKTYIGSIKVKNLHQDIELYETLTKDKSWPISQIIQREVDKRRVTNISKSYILAQGRPIKYFPPLIVAILPKDSEGKISANLNFEPETSSSIKEIIYSNSVYQTNPKIKPFVLEAENLSIVNGMYLLEVSKVFETYLLTWDKSKYHAIVIDGQHRLEALIKSASDSPLIEDHLQDVVFLDFSLLIQEEPSLTPIEIVRRVFVDINTNAQRVGFVRQILMDDKDLSSLCVQALVDSVKQNGELKDDSCYLKSQIVDWYGDKLKHTLPHLTGVLTLYQIIDDYLIQESLNSLKDLRSPRKVGKWVNRVNDVFMVDKVIESKCLDEFNEIKPLYQSFQEYEIKRNESKEYEDEIEDEYKETELFEFDYSILDVARHQFEKIYLKPIVKFFNELKPNSKTIEIIEHSGGFDPEQVIAKALVSSRNKLANTKAYRDALANLKVVIEETLSDKFYLFFTVLGQKAIFSNLFTEIDGIRNPDFDEATLFEIVNNHLFEVNRLFDFFEHNALSLLAKKENVIIEDLDPSIVDLGTIASSFWEGIIYENDNIIYNTQGIRSLSSILGEFILQMNDKDYSFDLSRIPYVKTRIRRILGKRFDFTDRQINLYTDEIVKAKNQFIKSYFHPTKE